MCQLLIRKGVISSPRLFVNKDLCPKPIGWGIWEEGQSYLACGNSCERSLKLACQPLRLSLCVISFCTMNGLLNFHFHTPVCCPFPWRYPPIPTLHMQVTSFASFSRPGLLTSIARLTILFRTCDTASSRDESSVLKIVSS